MTRPDKFKPLVINGQGTVKLAGGGELNTHEQGIFVSTYRILLIEGTPGALLAAQSMLEDPTHASKFVREGIVQSITR